MSTKGKRKPGRKDARGRNAASADLSLDDDEVFRIINQTDLMGGPAASLGGIPGSTAYKIMRPSELDAMRERQQQQQQQHPVNGSGSAGGKARKPLVELVDGDEADEDKGADDQDEEGTEGQEEEEDEHDDEPPIGEFGEEMFRLALNLIVFGTLWLCLCVSRQVSTQRLCPTADRCASTLRQRHDGPRAVWTGEQHPERARARRQRCAGCVAYSVLENCLQGILTRRYYPCRPRLRHLLYLALCRPPAGQAQSRRLRDGRRGTHGLVCRFGRVPPG